MRIALVSDWYEPRGGGLEQQMVDLGLALVQRGHSVDVITGTPGGSGDRGIAVHRLVARPRLPRWGIAWRPAAYAGLIDLIARGGYDVVHAHGTFSPLALGACLAAKRTGTAAVLSGHSVLKGAGDGFLRAVNAVAGWGEWPTVLTGVSTYVARELSVCAGRDAVVLPNGIDPSFWTRAEEPAVPLVASVTRFARRKHPEQLLRAIPHLTRILASEAEPRFVIAGSGHKLARTKREARRLGVDRHVQFAGWLDRDGVRDLLARSTVFVLASVKEALSIAVLEAAASGLPVIAMREGGVGDIVEHGQSGFLAENWSELPTHLATLLGDPALRRQMGAAARESAMRFSWDIVAPKHLQIYEAAIRLCAGEQPVLRPGDDSSAAIGLFR